MKTTKILISICVVLFLTTIKMTAQVTIGSQNAPNASAVLDLQTTNKGLLLPRVALTSTTAATPLTAHVAGMTVYNTATAGTGTNAVTPGQYYNNGAAWVRVQNETTTMVWVNTANPNTATSFDDIPYYDTTGGVDPAFTNDNSLKAKTSYIYIGTDGSSWIYNGTAYVTQVTPASTEWNIQGTSVDAGSSKVAAIQRSGPVYIGSGGGVSGALFVGNSKFVNIPAYNQDQNIDVISNGAAPVITKNGDYYVAGYHTQKHMIINKGITNSGAFNGILSAAFRRGTNDGGTLNLLAGVRSLWGHTAGEGFGLDDAVTNYAMGYVSSPSTGRGKINNAYDYYAYDYETPATVVNKYGVYINGLGKTNYFEGKVGIGTNAPNDKLQVVGGGLYVGPAATGTVWIGNLSSDAAQINEHWISVQNSVSGSSNILLTKNKTLLPNINGQAFQAFAYGTTGVATTTQLGSIKVNGTGDGVVYSTTSDKRLKENIVNTHYSLSDLMKISVKDYNFKSDETKTVQTGFLAQDLYEVYPEAVSVGGENAQENPWAVDYGKVTPLLVKAIQDQQQIIESQQKLIDQLDARIKALENK